MLLVERHQIQATQQIVELCKQSKELYNKCNYHMRHQWFQNLKNDNWDVSLPDISVLIQLVQHEHSFKNLHNTKTAKQTVRKCLIIFVKHSKHITKIQQDL